MASSEEVILNAAHAPHENAINAFAAVQSTVKEEVVKSRHHWDKHEPRMWSRAKHLSDEELTAFSFKEDLVEVRSGPTTYGTIIFGKIRIPKISDEEGEGFIHVRIHDPPNRGVEDVKFHSIYTEEKRDDPEQPPVGYRAIFTRDTPLVFFNE